LGFGSNGRSPPLLTGPHSSNPQKDRKRRRPADLHSNGPQRWLYLRLASVRVRGPVGRKRDGIPHVAGAYLEAYSGQCYRSCEILWVPDIRLRRWPGVIRVRSGMIRVRDIAAGVPDLLSAQRLDSATHAIGGIQECGDSCATNMSGGCDVEDRAAGCGAALVMEVGPPGSPAQGEVPNRRRLRR
jgi:hypothetical protein